MFIARRIQPSFSLVDREVEFCVLCMYVSCVCCNMPFILGVRLVDAPAGVTQGEGRTGLLHLPSTVLALI